MHFAIAPDTGPGEPTASGSSVSSAPGFDKSFLVVLSVGKPAVKVCDMAG